MFLLCYPYDMIQLIPIYFVLVFVVCRVTQKFLVELILFPDRFNNTFGHAGTFIFV